MTSSFYEIRIAGQLDPCWSEWLDDLTITPLASGETRLSGPLADRSALYGVLDRLRDMNMEIVFLKKETAGV